MKKLTKKEINLINNYKWATTYSLNDCYKNASGYKWRAYFNILNDFKDEHGSGLKVFNANSMQFSAAYTYEKDDTTFLKYYTKENIYIIPLN